MGFVAATALSFCFQFPRLSLHRPSSGRSRGLGGPVRREWPVLLRPGRPVHRQLARPVGNHMRSRSIGECRSPLAGWARASSAACRRPCLDPGLVTYAFAIAFHGSCAGSSSTLDRRVRASISTFPSRRLAGNDRWNFLMALALLGRRLVGQDLITSRSGRAMAARRRSRRCRPRHRRRQIRARIGHRRRLHRAGGRFSAYQFGFVGPPATARLSVQMLFGLVIGGVNSPAGAIVGGLFPQFFHVTAGLGKTCRPCLCRAADRRSSPCLTAGGRYACAIAPAGAGSDSQA